MNQYVEKSSVEFTLDEYCNYVEWSNGFFLRAFTGRGTEGDDIEICDGVSRTLGFTKVIEITGNKEADRVAKRNRRAALRRRYGGGYELSTSIVLPRLGTNEGYRAAVTFGEVRTLSSEGSRR